VKRPLQGGQLQCFQPVFRVKRLYFFLETLDSLSNNVEPPTPREHQPEARWYGASKCVSFSPEH
jgi:hypothetical protein